ncbi:MAG: prolyl oligopeptidase family serine peptidase [Polyangiaceae bacterium]
MDPPPPEPPTIVAIAPSRVAASLERVEVSGPSPRDTAGIPWSSLARTTRTPGSWRVTGTWSSEAGESLLVPTCAGRGTVVVDDVLRPAPNAGPFVVPLGPGRHTLRMTVKVSAYEKRIACSAPPTFGRTVASARSSTGVAEGTPTPDDAKDGAVGGTVANGAGRGRWMSLAVPTASSAKGGARAVAYVPASHDVRAACAVLVGLHPWNGSPWTYAAYEELLVAADARDVCLLFPDGLGNSLYTAAAEDAVLAALDAFGRSVAVDSSRVSIWGASMGGAGATTIGFHHPDRFARITSLFGDSKYDMTTYVKGILGDDAGARRVNALDVADNVRHVPVHLVHGEDDRVSPIVQSSMLADALRSRGYAVTFDRVADAGHDGALVARTVRGIVDEAARARAPKFPTRVTYRSVRLSDTSVYGVTFVRRGPGDAFVDVEAIGGSVRVHGASNVARILLGPGALGLPDGAYASPGDVDVEGSKTTIRVERTPR